MQLWLTSFILLFGAAEFWQWVQQASLPMPIFVLGGVFLAIASNYTKLSNLPLHLDDKALNSSFNPVTSTQANQAVSPANPQKSSVRPSPVSFEIQKPFKPGD
ncbi:MAG: hypothetical protein DCF22_03815 [Leptolyngbya sp.]|nr:MAG: hypothetical protein DCF22_03815 [Leptolyngbya sp.]